MPPMRPNRPLRDASTDARLAERKEKGMKPATGRSFIDKKGHRITDIIIDNGRVTQRNSILSNPKESWPDKELLYGDIERMKKSKNPTNKAISSYVKNYFKKNSQ